MQIFFRIRRTVMMTMMGCPPERPSLSGSRAQESKQELHLAPRLKRLVGKITVVKRRDREHTNHIGRNGNAYGNRAHSDQKDAQTGHMQRHEWPYTPPVDRLIATIQHRTLLLVVNEPDQTVS